MFEFKCALYRARFSPLRRTRSTVQQTRFIFPSGTSQSGAEACKWDLNGTGALKRVATTTTTKGRKKVLFKAPASMHRAAIKNPPGGTICHTRIISVFLSFLGRVSRKRESGALKHFQTSSIVRLQHPLITMAIMIAAPTAWVRSERTYCRRRF